MDRRSRQHSNGIGQHRGRMSAGLEHLPLRTWAALLLGALSLIASRASGTEIPAEEKRSDYQFMSQETRAIQDDDSVNPGMFSVLEGEALWSRKDGASKVSCADCHTIANMRGIAARYPRFDLDPSVPSIFRGKSTAAARGARMQLHLCSRAGSCWLSPHLSLISRVELQFRLRSTKD